MPVGSPARAPHPRRPDGESVGGGAVRGHDGTEKIVGRRSHVAVDGDGRLLMVNLMPANVSDSAGARTILNAIRRCWPWIRHPFVDGVHDRTRLMGKAVFLDFVIEVVRRPDNEPGFKVAPRCRIIERGFARLTRRRRLVRDHEQRLDVSEDMIRAALGCVLRRISH